MGTQSSHKISTPENFNTVFYIVILCSTFKGNKLGTEWKVSKYRFFSGPYFPVFSPNTRKYGPEKNSVFGRFSRSEDVRKTVWFLVFFGVFSRAIKLLFLKHISRWMILNLVWQNPCKIMKKQTPPYPFYSFFFMNFQKIGFI